MKTMKIWAALGFAVAALTAAPVEAKEWKTVRIGMDASYAPFESVNSSGEIVGWEVDYAKILCAKMKVTCTFQNQDWDGIIPALMGDKFDVIFSSMNITKARAEKVLFSQPYYSVPPAFITTASNASNDISPAALKGKTIGTQSSTIHVNYLEKYYKGSEIKTYPTQDEANLDLANGRLDYVTADALVLEEFVNTKGKGTTRFVATYPRDPEVHGPGVGAAFRPADKDLADMFNKAIDEADADGSYKKSEAPYFKMDIRGK